MVRFLIDKGIAHSAVHVAAFCGDLDEVKSYLAAGGDINARDRSWLTLLSCAILGQHTAEVEFLISKGADINLEHIDGGSALFWAVVRRPEITKMLLDKGADVTIRSGNGRTALFWAACRDNKDIVETMLAKGADVNAKGHFRFPTGDGYDEGLIPLHAACGNGHKAVVEVLIAHGADVNAKTKNGQTPMSRAKKGSHEQIVELLRKHGAKE
jgi:cytohesin